MSGPRRLLFLYLTKHSGHYSAAVAVEEAFRRLDPAAETLLLDSFSHTNPMLSKVTLRAYLAMLRTAPEIWEYMYDNLEFKVRTARIRELLNRGSSRKLNTLLGQFRPQVVSCTQAFACGVMASWKRANNRPDLKLVGILTDFVAHRYWADPDVDLYIAPSEELKSTLVAQGVPPERVCVTGIPVHERFAQPVDRAEAVRRLQLRPELPKILLMGGSLGLGPMKAVIRKLDKLPQPFEMLAVTGQNEELKESLERRGRRLRHHTRIMGFVDNVPELMAIAEVVITKPGGITTAEALIKNLPMVIISPIPGQEAKNSEYLLAHNVAVQAEDATDVMLYVDEFLRNPARLSRMRAAATEFGRPQSAAAAAEAIYGLFGGAPRTAAVREQAMAAAGTSPPW
ncbi:UDP-N-acetylglucosamine 2-epimerase [bacterium]|nr:UDP-N-acetylglucosamine 2-epimerase [bacterium]